MKAKENNAELNEKKLRAKMLVYVIGMAIFAVLLLELVLSLPGVMP